MLNEIIKICETLETYDNYLGDFRPGAIYPKEISSLNLEKFIESYNFSLYCEYFESEILKALDNLKVQINSPHDFTDSLEYLQNISLLRNRFFDMTERFDINCKTIIKLH